MLKGQRIEIPVHFDMWMRGARFGTVTSIRYTSDKPDAKRYATVRMDHTQVKRSVRIAESEWEYVRVVS